MNIRLLFACADIGAGTLLARAMEDDAAGLAIACELTSHPRVVLAATICRPDVLLLEQQALHDDTLSLLSQAAVVSPVTRALVLYETSTHEQVIEWVRRGASGAVGRNSNPQLLAKAVRTVYHGGIWYGRTALLQALRSRVGLQEPEPAAEEHRLTQREEEILRLIGEGLTNKEIGRRLDISDQTVKTHLHRVYAKLHQSGRYKAFLAQPRPSAGGQRSQP